MSVTLVTTETDFTTGSTLCWIVPFCPFRESRLVNAVNKNDHFITIFSILCSSFVSQHMCNTKNKKPVTLQPPPKKNYFTQSDVCVCI